MRIQSPFSYNNSAHAWVVAVALTSVILTAEAQTQPAPPAPVQAEPAQTAPAPAQMAPTPAPTAPAQAAPAPAPAQSAPPANASSPRFFPLDLRQVHPNGTSIHVTGLTVDRLFMAVDISIVNGNRNVIRLNNSNIGNPAVLIDDKNNSYRISPPKGNDQVQIRSGEGLEGKLIFLGQLQPGTQSLTLLLNPNGDDNNDNTTTPRFKVQLPLAGGAAIESLLTADATMDKKKP